jgi:hypothetical protein
LNLPPPMRDRDVKARRSGRWILIPLGVVSFVWLNDAVRLMIVWACACVVLFGVVVDGEYDVGDTIVMFDLCGDDVYCEFSVVGVMG